jgi:hypothetical protein
MERAGERHRRRAARVAVTERDARESNVKLSKCHNERKGLGTVPVSGMIAPSPFNLRFRKPGLAPVGLRDVRLPAL